MKKKMFLIAFTIASCCIHLTSFADEIQFDSTIVYPISSMQRLASVHLNENENTIQLFCNDIGNAYDEFYLSIYRETTEDSSGYVLKFFGPIDITNFKISGLDGNEDYNIRLSSVGESRKISGKIVTSFEEVLR